MRTTLIALAVTTILVMSGFTGAQAGPRSDEADPKASDVSPTETISESDEEFLGPSDMEKDDAFLTDTEKAEIEAPEEEKDIDLHEDPDEKLFSVGARLRWIMIPEWFIKMFGVDTKQRSKYESSLPLISNVGVGPEFTYRKGGFDITAAIWYVGLGWDPISMKGSSEDENSWEVIENDMRAILITFDFLWSTSITDWFAITYGAGLGLGIPWGDVIETEARQYGTVGPNGEPLDQGLYKCEFEPATAGEVVDPWCQPGEDYGKTYDKLKVIPWIEFLVGVRFKPHRHFAVYVDGGFGLGFQIGTRAGYIF